MEQSEHASRKLFIMYFAIILFVLLSNAAFGQIQIAYFNSDWNKANGVAWVHDLTDVTTTSTIDIANQTELAKKHKIAVIPTIIIFKDGEEILRFQADLSFKMVAVKEEVQDEIDNIIMSDF